MTADLYLINCKVFCFFIYKLCLMCHLAIVRLLLPFQGSIRKAKTAAKTRLADPISSGEEMAGRQLLQKCLFIIRNCNFEKTER